MGMGDDVKRWSEYILAFWNYPRDWLVMESELPEH